MKNLILLSIFLVPLSSILPIDGTIVWFPQLLVLISIGLIALSLRFWKMNKFISMFLIYQIFSFIFITGQSPRTMLCLIISFSAVALAFEVSNIKDSKIINKFIIGMAIFQFVYVVLQYFGIDFFFHGLHSKTDIVGFAGSHNQLGAYYASVSTLLTSIHPLLSLVSIVPIFLAKQNGAMIGLVFGVFVYLLFMRNKKALIVLGVIVLLGIVPWIMLKGKSNAEIMERVNLWKSTYQQITTGKALEDISPNTHKVVTCNPFFGFGLGNFFTISPHTQSKFLAKYGQHVYEHAHNDLLESLFEFGYVGFILVILCILSVLGDFINYAHFLHNESKNLIIYFSSIFAMAVSSFVIYIFHAPLSLFMFSLMLGLFYGEVRKCREQDQAVCLENY